ncbi:general secretion pathway protein GspJ [Bradyrhizobium sp. INPA01-394B]|uniref:General secretion pathway protein GspJ n=1 Tax=Bradyrhizobium campsiandrae TaxID=1729892 RepID=A0ABR7U8R5_9BRAD|nr:general secretion pathway protein GspJ [Bradyrhizobium campsiandrae]MBC9876239.1 general secretion pathway protein GspJ [Bradyrhizobium campsiandrae]MBC9980454.1 general secretion pathway protein GspJ [Bradyrhizobium campsiandrae]
MKRRHRAFASEAGFTLLEVLLATLLMTVILAALATVTAQWLPNWNRGIARVQRAERLATGIDRIVADLSVAEQIAVNGDAKAPLFDGAELSVTFLRTALGPSLRPGLEFIRLVEKADSEGLALVRERAPFQPMATGGQIRFVDQVVLIRAPFRVSFAYAGPDRTWQPTWHGQGQLPDRIRITVRDGGTGQMLAVSAAVVPHITAPAECARAKNPTTCVTPASRPQQAQKEEQQL